MELVWVVDLHGYVCRSSAFYTGNLVGVEILGLQSQVPDVLVLFGRREE